MNELYGEEDELDCVDQFGRPTSPPWEKGQQIGFRLKRWTKANDPGRHAKRPPPPSCQGNTQGPPLPPPSGGPPDAPRMDASQGSGTGQFQSSTRPAGTKKVAATVLVDDL
jgi:hypothetical protein